MTKKIKEKALKKFMNEFFSETCELCEYECPANSISFDDVNNTVSFTSLDEYMSLCGNYPDQCILPPTMSIDDWLKH